MIKFSVEPEVTQFGPELPLIVFMVAKAMTGSAQVQTSDFPSMEYLVKEAVIQFLAMLGSITLMAERVTTLSTVVTRRITYTVAVVMIF
ncbi:hypothetical protein A8B82_21710 [Sulfitobacter sp. EhC04]|nr:hypothetical protein A8B82_21710 [Sulfitobacter sp. EhC04]